MLDDALRSRKTHVLLAALTCYIAFEVWLTLAAPGKVAAGFPAARGVAPSVVLAYGTFTQLRLVAER